MNEAMKIVYLLLHDFRFASLSVEDFAFKRFHFSKEYAKRMAQLGHDVKLYIMADDIIEFDVAVTDTAPKPDDGTTITIRVGTPLEEVERRVTMATLAYCGHVKRKAAEILGVSLKTLYNRLETYNGKEAVGTGDKDESANVHDSLR